MMSIICFQGSLRPEEALQSLTIYEGKFGRLKDDREKCARAKEALELTDTGLLSGSEERVQVNKGPLKDPHEGTTHKALDLLSFVFLFDKILMLSSYMVCIPKMDSFIFGGIVGRHGV